MMASPQDEAAESLIPKPDSYEMGDRSRDSPPITQTATRKTSKHLTFLKTGFVIAALIVAAYCTLRMLYETMTGTSSSCPNPHKEIPQYFDPNPELWPGPTATGRAPFLAMETVVPDLGPKPNRSIERLWGHLSPYSSNHDGWGVDEYPLPEGSEITQVHVLHRHGSRYPTVGVSVQTFGSKIASLKGKFTASGPLSFLNAWDYGLGDEIMVPSGRLQLFESGVHRYYQYGHLYTPGTKILVRSTTQKRMRQSVQNFLSGFFGLDWTDYAVVGYGIEGFSKEARWNNSLAGYDNCPNSNNFRNEGGHNASVEWEEIYLQNATERINNLITGVDFDAQDVYAMQNMCPYEFAAFGYSPFCQLFTYAEWEGFEYSIDLWFSGGYSYQSPTGRAVGLGWHQEFLARLEQHMLPQSKTPHSQINTTLDSETTTFPLNQSLYLDFSHDTNIMSILTSLGFTQFSQPLLGNSHPGPHNLTVSNVTPFGARLDVEVLKTQRPVLEDRLVDGSSSSETSMNPVFPRDEEVGETRYVRFKLNERTLPHPGCPWRRDGMCEMATLIEVLKEEEKKAMYDFACFGEYEAVEQGRLMDGHPEV